MNFKLWLENDTVPMSEGWISQLAAKLVEKYPKPNNVSMMSNMGHSILFSTDAKIEDVRNWLDSTKFNRISARKYVLEMPVINVMVYADIEKETYGFYAINLTAVRKKS